MAGMNERITMIITIINSEGETHKRTFTKTVQLSGSRGHQTGRGRGLERRTLHRRHVKILSPGHPEKFNFLLKQKNSYNITIQTNRTLNTLTALVNKLVPWCA